MKVNGWNELIVLEALSTAALEMQKGRFARAERHCLKALEELQKPGAPGVQVAGGMFLTAANYHAWATHGSTGKFREAEQMYRQALAAREAACGSSDEFALQTRLTLADLYEAWANAGQVNKLTDLEHALRGWLTASSSDSPQAPAVLSRLADLYESTGRLDLAERELMRAIDIADCTPEPSQGVSSLQARLAALRQAQHSPPGAKTVLTKRGPTSAKADGEPTTPRLDPAEAAFVLGCLAELDNNDGLAEGSYRRAAELGHAAASFRLGALLLRRNDRKRAEEAYERAEMLGEPKAGVVLGTLMWDAGDLAGAEAAFSRADQRGDADGACYLGALLQARDDLTGAEAAYQRADERGDAYGAINRAVLLEQRGELAAAEAAYLRASERDSGDIGERAQAALVHLRER